jgi:hypothetical protein
MGEVWDWELTDTANGQFGGLEEDARYRTSGGQLTYSEPPNR